MLIRWLHITSAIVLAGTLFALRVLVLPSLSILQPEEAIQLLGRLMTKVRRTLQVSLVVLIATGIYRALSALFTTSWLWWSKLILSALLLVVVLLLSLSPERKLALKLQAERKVLLNWSLVLATLIILISAYLNSSR